MGLSMDYVPREAAGKGGPAVFIDHISLVAVQVGNIGDTLAAHGKCSGGIAVNVVNIRSDNGQADDVRDGGFRVFRVVDMLSADIRPGGRHAAVADRKHLDDFVQVKRITDTHAPVLTLAIFTNRLEIAPGLDVEIFVPFLADHFRGIENRPAFDQPGRVCRSITVNVKIAVRLQPDLLGQSKHRLHVRAGLFQYQFVPVEHRDFALILIRAKFIVDGLEVSEYLVE